MIVWRDGSFARQCDMEGCDTWQRLESPLLQDWREVTDTSDGEVLHFCHWDHVLLFGARFSPREVTEIPD